MGLALSSNTAQAISSRQTRHRIDREEVTQGKSIEMRIVGRQNLWTSPRQPEETRTTRDMTSFLAATTFLARRLYHRDGLRHREAEKWQGPITIGTTRPKTKTLGEIQRTQTNTTWTPKNWPSRSFFSLHFRIILKNEGLSEKFESFHSS